MRGTTRRALSTAAGLGLMLSASLAGAQETIKLGALATLEGPFTVLGEDSHARRRSWR